MKADEILEKVCRSFDALIDVANCYDGLFPSLLDRKSQKILEEVPEAIPGQRQGDRSHPGCNLIHDEAALKTMYGLSEGLGKSEYAEAADRYLRYYAENCTDTATGLFPWGEHAFWHLSENRVGSGRELSDPAGKGDAIHDHLRQAPLWLWEKLQGFNPECVQRFAEGLDGHWTEGEPLEYIRHAHIEVVKHHARGARSCDFPRHGGFYILDWAFAYRQSEKVEFLEQIRAMVEYWWPRRDERSLLLIESRSPEEDVRFYNINAPGQTLSLAASLLESLPLLEDRESELCATMRERALAYIDGFLAAPHDLEKGSFSILSRRDNNEMAQEMPIWGSVYGVWPASYVALTALCAHRLTRDERLLEWAEAVGQRYAAEVMPGDVAAPAMDAGLGLGLLADLYDLTGEERWLAGGMALAERSIEVYFDEADLPRGAAGIDWYESQMGPSFLQHGLARIALLAQNRESCPLEADYTAR